jgi:hypothetical protein
LFLITTLSGQAGNIQHYVHEYYSVARFKATYAHDLPALEGKQQWDIVAGRPRKSQIRPRSKGAGLGARKHKCTRCGGSGHFAKYCDNTVDPAFGECSGDENDGQQPVAPDDENDAQNEAPNDDFANYPNDDSNNDQNEAPNDDSDDDQNEAPNGDQIDEQSEQNDAPIEAPNDGDQNVEKNDAPSVVLSSAWYVNLANTILHLSLDMISQPFMFLLLYISVVGSNKVVADNQEEKCRIEEHKEHKEQSGGKHKDHKEQSGGKKHKDKKEAPSLWR